MAPLSCILTLAPFSCFKTMPKGFCIHSSHFASHSLSLSPSPPFTPPTSLQLSDLSRSRRRKESGEGWEGGISERKLVRRNQTGSLSWERRTSVGREEQGGLVGMIENQRWGLSEWIKNKGILLTPCKKKHFQKAEFVMIFLKIHLYIICFRLLAIFESCTCWWITQQHRLSVLLLLKTKAA